MRRLMTIGVLCAGTVLSGAAAAQSFPARAIEIDVPYAAGGGTDVSMRVLAETLSAKLDGATVIVRNTPGGGGAIGTGDVLKAAPDGYTLGTGAQGPIALLPHYGGTTYTIDDVDFLALLGRNLQVVLACANAPFEDFAGFLDYARENEGATLVGNSGAGGANHLSMEAFGTEAGVTFEHVAFGGASEALTNCAGGHVDAVTATPSEARPHIESGNVRPIFVMEAERIEDMPEVPTAVENGVDFTWSSWKGVIAPKGLPDDVRATLTEALAETMQDEAFLARMAELGEFVDYRDSAGYEALARADSEMAESIIEDLGMTGMNAN